MKIGTRLGAAFAVLLGLLCCVALVGAVEVRRINDNVVDMEANELASVKLLGDLQTRVAEVRADSLAAVVADDPSLRTALEQRHADVVQRALPETLSAYEKTVSGTEEERLYRLIDAKWAAYREQDSKLQALVDGGESSRTAARAFSLGAPAAAFGELVQAIDEDTRLNSDTARASADAAAASYREAITSELGLSAVALLLGAALAFLITRTITKPIREAVRVAETVARGDLSATVAWTGKDETADLLRALDMMNASLRNIVADVRRCSDSIATGSSQIATGNADLSQRTEEQASNLQQTAASMEQIRSTVVSATQASQEASQVAASAAQAALEGGSAVGRVVATMQEISGASQRIADIVGVIDGIAFQTNILALNAAVEAARAGEEGRGFAVVAGEVRSLAQRAGEAAKEIRVLIGSSVDKVDVGAREVEAAGAAMKGIVDRVQRVSQLVAEISDGAIQQGSGIEQIGDAVNQLDHVTQQNAALVEESAAAAQSLNSQAARLAETVKAFVL